MSEEERHIYHMYTEVVRVRHYDEGAKGEVQLQ